MEAARGNVTQGLRPQMTPHRPREMVPLPAQIGAQRYLDLVRRYGHDTVHGAYEDLMDYSERMMRRAIAAMI